MTAMTGPSRNHVIAIAAALVACAGQPALAQQAGSDPANGLAGWWQMNQPFVPLTFAASPPPFTEAAAEQYAAAGSAVAEGETWDFCQRPMFVGYNLGIASDLEILSTPGRLTLIADETGLVRRIYLRDGPAPGPVAPTSSGTSFGRWDGDALVVETAGLHAEAPYPTSVHGSPALGEGAHVTERLYLQDADTLVIEAEVTAPAILTGPDRRRYTYGRVDRDVAYVEPLCTVRDRSVDLATNRQQFDMTPPPDLPPPPN